jgi:hypothetical protein
MANEFKIKNGFLIGDQTPGEYSVAVSGVVDDLTTSVDHDIVTGPAIQGYIDTEVSTLSGYFDAEISGVVGAHGNLTGLASDDHTQYILHDGTRAFTGDVNMSGFNITNPGLVDGIDIATDVAANTLKETNTNITHTGDVTDAAGVLTIANLAVTSTKIANNTVGNTKLAQVATDTIKGRTAAGTGNVTDLTAAEVRAIINVEDGAAANPELTKSIYIDTPVADDDIGIWEPGFAITITKVVFKGIGATSTTFNINHSAGTDLWVDDKIASTTRQTSTSFTDATCTANNYIRYQASAISGTPTALEITITYTEDV